MIKKQFTFNNLNYLIKELDETDDAKLKEYCETCHADGVPNNSSISNMKVNRWGTDKWWGVYNLEKDIIVSASGAHPFEEYAPGHWRVMFRLATIKEFRGKAGPFSKDQRNCFGWGHILPFQIEYCKQMGAKNIVFTTNCDENGDANSMKQDKICSLVFERLNMAQKIDQKIIFNTNQNIWKVLIEDVMTKKPLVL
ncbi:hypothetical protein SHI21_10590 [Bacteriovorax sp. PP10]|uniref:Uncharacterized protein n=1 Tax=Bacteriovorax antarcticus TaxID=3088717 RepID=A0ABU5VUL2_9BACT|nr:hypothetical protein [Bacteriovorax sp. PP10]MEA9356656.1 hypothetical protein [Bacteriovorax sp. PP10]